MIVRINAGALPSISETLAIGSLQTAETMLEAVVMIARRES